jgi:hypothetical protein
VLSDGRFAIFGGEGADGLSIASCEALTLDADGERWVALPSLHAQISSFTCAAIGRCVIVAGGRHDDAIVTTIEVYEEELRRWWRLPCALPYDGLRMQLENALT